MYQHRLGLRPSTTNLFCWRKGRANQREGYIWELVLSSGTDTKSRSVETGKSPEFRNLHTCSCKQNMPYPLRQLSPILAFPSTTRVWMPRCFSRATIYMPPCPLPIVPRRQTPSHAAVAPTTYPDPAVDFCVCPVALGDPPRIASLIASGCACEVTPPKGRFWQYPSLSNG